MLSQVGSIVEGVCDALNGLVKDMPPAYGIYRYNILLRRKVLVTVSHNKTYIDKQVLYLQGLNHRRKFMRFVVIKGISIFGEFIPDD